MNKNSDDQLWIWNLVAYVFEGSILCATNLLLFITICNEPKLYAEKQYITVAALVFSSGMGGMYTVKLVIQPLGHYFFNLPLRGRAIKKEGYNREGEVALEDLRELFIVVVGKPLHGKQQKQGNTAL